jgi:endonuclease YncB( thermonuclease family)
MYEYAGTVLRVIDGDTFVAKLDLGFKINFTTNLRLAGINAPELKTDDGKLSRTWLNTRLAIGTAIKVRTFKDRPDKYGGRYDAVVYANSETSINEEIVTAGFAAKRDY